MCQSCPVDTYNDLQGQAVCEPCPPGTHTNGQTGQEVIMDCSPLPSPMPTSSPFTVAPHQSTRPSSFSSNTVAPRPSTRPSSNPSFEPSHSMPLSSTPSVDPTMSNSMSPRPSSIPSAHASSSYQTSLGPSAELAMPTSPPTLVSLSCYKSSNQNQNQNQSQFFLKKRPVQEVSIYKYLHSHGYCHAGCFHQPCHCLQTNVISNPSPLLHWFGLFATVVISWDKCPLHMANDCGWHTICFCRLQL